ncbi:hypothetical protein D046_3265A, partial [Vibrio parahaemolyticus V-223/04]
MLKNQKVITDLP